MVVTAKVVGTSIRAVKVTSSLIVNSSYLIHAVHDFDRNKDGSARGFRGFAKVVSQATIDLPERLASFKDTMPSPTGNVLVTFSPQFGTVFNVVTNKREWETHFLSSLLELPKVLPSGSVVHMPLVGCGVYQAKPHQLWRVLFALPADYPINLVVHDLEGALDPYLHTTPGKMVYPAMTNWQSPKSDLLVPYSTGSFVSHLVWAWLPDLDRMRVPRRDVGVPVVVEPPKSVDDLGFPLDLFASVQIFSMMLVIVWSAACEQMVIFAFGLTLLFLYGLFLVKAIHDGHLQWKLTPESICAELVGCLSKNFVTYLRRLFGTEAVAIEKSDLDSKLKPEVVGLEKLPNDEVEDSLYSMLSPYPVDHGDGFAVDDWRCDESPG